MKVSTYEKLHNLDETMHLHVGYDEHGFDYEGVFFKSLDRKMIISLNKIVEH
ncbi:DUF3986 family protein [Bacillus altitudinis]|uniref:DUF3986 domain-containing protein n=1 Tax=Bacillus altitudinis TaxID=293387 RepID=A0A653TX79_BACAB|nr:DUF3986 family protein [Bacillus altitudinis]VXB81934.1 hypothetical protein BACI348_41637 [Bacillus altitudinis]